jgi:5'-nucleotidase
MHSGTVCAVVGALNQGLNGPIPGIAISTGEPDCDDDCVRNHYRNVADYLAELIEHLQSKPGFLEAESGFLPKGVGLNVNYPPLARAQIQGVRVTKQGRFFGFVEPYVVSVRCAECVGLAIGETAPSNLTREIQSEPEAEDTDSAAFYAGYITIVPIEADLTGRNYERFAEVVTTKLTPPD